MRMSGNRWVHRASRRLGTLIITAALFALPSITGLARAEASNYSGTTGATGCNNLNEADNSTHTFYYVSLEPIMVEATNWARTNVYNPTRLSTQLVSSETSVTDVVVYDVDYTSFCGFTWCCETAGGGAVGHVQCMATNSAGECEKHRMRYETDFTRSTTTTNRRGLACHETGHTVGLKHGGGACMEQNYPKPSIWLSPHDVYHIDNNY